MFFRLAFGAVAIGLAFGIGVNIVLYHLNRGLSSENNVVQVVLTITAAYLAFFTQCYRKTCSLFEQHHIRAVDERGAQVQGNPL